MRFDYGPKYRKDPIRHFCYLNKDDVENIEFLDDLKSTHIEMRYDNNAKAVKMDTTHFTCYQSSTWRFATQLQFR